MRRNNLNPRHAESAVECRSLAETSAPVKEWRFFYFFTVHFSLCPCRLSNRVTISENIALRRKNITPDEVRYLSTGNEAEYITKIMFYVK